SNTSGDEGGGVHVLSGTVTIDNSAILDNFADDDGGGLDIESDATVTVTNSMIDRNTADDDGGGIEVNGSLWLLNSSLNENQADDRAAMDGDSSADFIIIHGTMISGNVSQDLGGGVDFDGDAMVHISDSLIQNNQVLDAGGAGIDNFATLFITDTHIIGNFASNDCGGIENNGVMTLTNVTISGNQAQSGAGLCTDSNSSSVIVDSQIENNIATQNGGGVQVSDQGVMTLTNSTIANNTAAQSGGLFNDNGQVTLTNSTVSGNQADEDGILTQIGVSATLQLVHASLANNTAVVTDTGMGIISGTVTLTNSIIADNGAANCALGGGTLVSGGYNLEDGGSCALSGAGDITNTDPLLDGLADNGGNTQTHALLAGSPAIDAIPDGVNGCGIEFVTDQRGEVRPFGDGCDIGSFEKGLSTIYLPVIFNQ
ncbi:MAG: right-handed parallel beta-helix repeat-containing protein, partial [Ardenticatenaceae bacterium]|nr:right-handed parallel beta-helix repeat-containing protein [Ardenticatenaceae bacterium]